MSNHAELRASTLADVLAALVLTIGYRPTESVVIAGLRPNNRIGVVARVDLAQVTPQGADTIAVAVANDRAEGAVVVVYSDDHDTARDVQGAMTCALHGQAVEVEHAIHVTASTYTDLNNDEATPQPLSDVEASHLTAHAVHMGRNLHATRADLLPRPADQDARDLAARAYADQIATGDQATDAVATWRLMLAGMLDGPRIYGEMAARLTDIRVRDAVLLTLVPGVTAEAVDRTVEGRDDNPTVGRALATVVSAEHGQKPGHAAHDGADVLAEVIAHVPDNTAAWTLWAMLAWWSGNGIAARDGLERAADDYRLAALLRQVVDTGMAPGWVRRQRDAW